MADPFIVGSAGFYEEVSYVSQTYSGLEEGPSDANMTFVDVDPNLHNPSAFAYTNPWEVPARHALEQFAVKTHAKAAFSNPHRTGQTSNRTQIPSSTGISLMALPLQARFPSPVPGAELPPIGSALSPHADTESYPDNLPRTPSDTVLLSPFQAPMPLDPYYAVQFTGMGPSGYVNPFDVNPNLQSDYSESDSGHKDFDFSRLGASLDSHASHSDSESAHTTAAPNFLPERMASPEQILPVAEDQINNALTQYPLPPRDDGRTDSDNGRQVPLKRQNNDDADADADADADYQPHKKRKPATRALKRRAAKTDAPASAPPSRRTPRGRAGNVAPPASRALPSLSSHLSKTTLACPECSQSTFRSQSELDAHVKKSHQRHPFNCVFDFAGCTKTFPNKNEWKRHVGTQHLLLYYWKCMEGDCANAQSNKPSPSTHYHHSNNLFNRKDLFTQHYRRMHAEPSIRDHLPTSAITTATTGKRKLPASSTSTSTTSSKPDPEQAARLREWQARLQRLQKEFRHERCPQPTLMRCPVRGCERRERQDQAFRGEHAWDQRMEHVAKHMERAAQGTEAKVVFGGEGDPTLVEWACQREVGIISRRRGPVAAGGEEDGEREEEEEGKTEWVLNVLWKKGPGGSVPAFATGAGAEVMMAEDGHEEVRETIEVSQSIEDDDGEEEEEDAEGEEDD